MFGNEDRNLEPNNPYEEKIEWHYKINGTGLLVLACLRIITLDFFSIINDLFTI